MKLASPSATPSMMPSDAAPDFSTDWKKAGKIETTISAEKSLKKETSPMRKTFFSIPNTRAFFSAGEDLFSFMGSIVTPNTFAIYAHVLD